MIDVAEFNVDEIKPCKKGKSIEQADSADRISNLPDDIIHHIFFFLSIIDVVRTSTLARRWRYLWNKAPNLIFDDVLVGKGNTFANIVDGVQKLYKSPNIERYILSVQQPKNAHLVDGCVHFAVQRNVKELYVNTLANKPFEMQCCRALKVLRLDLQEGELTLPITGCFSSLETISLTRAMVTDDAILYMISNQCPHLKSLSLRNCIGLNYLNISSPTLEDLNIEMCFGLKQLNVSAGRLQMLSVENSFNIGGKTDSVMISAPNLQSFKWLDYIVNNFHIEGFTSLKVTHIALAHDYYPEVKNAFLRSARKLISHLACSESLGIDIPCFWGLSTQKELLEGLPTPPCNLKHLKLLVGHDQHEFEGISHLFRICANLETLRILVIDDESERLLNSRFSDVSIFEKEVLTGYQRTSLNHLLEVRIEGFRGTASEIEFVHFLLEYAVILKIMFIFFSAEAFANQDTKTIVKNALMTFTVTSPKVAMHFY